MSKNDQFLYVALALWLSTLGLILWPLLRAKAISTWRKALAILVLVGIWFAWIPNALAAADWLLTKSGRVANRESWTHAWTQVPEDASDIVFHHSSGMQSICCRTSVSGAEKWLREGGFAQPEVSSKVQPQYPAEILPRLAFAPSLSDPGLRRYSTPWAATGAHRRAFYSPRDQRLYTELSSR